MSAPAWPLVVQRVAHGDAFVVGDGERVLEHHVGGVDAAAHHRWAEAAALLIGPIHQLERRARDDAGLVQRTNHFQAGEHAEHAIEPPAGRHGVQMAAEGDRACGVIGASAAEEHVADRILLEAKVQRLAPLQQQCAGLGVLG